MKLRHLFAFAGVWLLVFYLIPVAVSAAIWFSDTKPLSYRDADWSSSGQIGADIGEGAEIRVYGARAGRYKGILAVHTWLLVKPEGQRTFDRYEVVGWGNPVRVNAYAPDARWYSNEPELIQRVTGERARRAVPKLVAAIENYPFRHRGTYRVWPGPNSNTFVSHVLAAVPDLKAQLPPTAIGKDFPVDGRMIGRTAGGYRLSAGGLVSVLAGRAGFEVNLFGLVAGFDVLRPALKLPGIGRIGLPATAA
ncbi:DUF3750 domain-containing protein [Tepidamorphus sp. 3E244]|uniref:DUF3750 domain-containing protein n=1 Tax=Tepidamorphus sp. 3E244 TaxID=3385498 RepID=UPI0038FCE0A2